MNRLLAFLVCSLAVAVCAAADPGGPVLDGAGYICVTVPGVPCPPTAWEIVVVFDEDVDPVTGTDPANYAFHPVDDPEGLIPVAEVFGVWDNEAYLFLAALPDEVDYLLTVVVVEDLDGNPMVPQSVVVEPMLMPDSVPDVAVPVLLPAAPNPFNPATTLRFVLPDLGGSVAAAISIHDLRGRVVRRLPLPAALEPGLNTVPWNGCDDRGLAVASGTYVVRLAVDGWTGAQSVTLAK